MTREEVVIDTVIEWLEDLENDLDLEMSFAWDESLEEQRSGILSALAMIKQKAIDKGWYSQKDTE